VIGHSAVFIFDVWASECAVLGNAAFHALAPQPKRAGLKLVPHEANDLWLRPSHALLNGFKGSPIFPSHLNDGRNITL
jgi:hypothetical protein